MASVQDIMDELSDHGFTDTSVTRKVAMINDSVGDICSRDPWPFIEQTIDLTFDGTNSTPSNFPTDFRSALDIYNATTGQTMIPLRLDVADKTYGTQLTQSGNPMAYYFLNGQLKVFNIPAAGQTLRMRYLRTHPTLVQADVEAAILIPARHHRVITLGALWKLYDMEDDPELAVRFEQHYENRINTMRNDIWMKQYDRTEVIAVIDNDDMDLNYWG